MRTKLHRGLECASDLSGLSFWLTSGSIEAAGQGATAFLWLGVLACEHGMLHLTLVNVASFGDYNHSFRVAEDVLGIVERR